MRLYSPDGVLTRWRTIGRGLIDTPTTPTAPDGCSRPPCPAGRTASCRYDPFGRRYSNTVTGVTTVYVHHLAGNDIAAYDGASGSILRHNRFSPTPRHLWRHSD